MRHQIPIIVVLCFMLDACTGSKIDTLKQADAIMEQDADSALHVLESIDQSQLSHGELPYFALLMTQAQVKTNVPLDSDSLISIAYKKYDGSWRGDKGIRSNFYMGEVLYNQDKPRDAMKYYLNAYEESKRLSNDYWHAKSAECIADLFFNAYNYAEAAKYRKETIEFFGKSERFINQRYAIADLATEYINDSKYDKGLHLLDSVYEITKMENADNTHLLKYIRRMRIGALVSVGKTNELTESDIRLLEDNMYANDSLDSKILRLEIEDTRNHNKLNEEDFMDILSSAKTAEDKVFTLYAYYRHIKLHTDDSFEREVIDSLLFYQNAVAETVIKESVLSAERDFYSRLSVKRQREARLKLHIIWAVGIVVGFIAIISIIFIRLRNRAHKSELDAMIESLMNIKALSEKINAEKTTLALKINERTTALSELKQKIDRQDAIIEKLRVEDNDNKQLIDDFEKEKVGLNNELNTTKQQLSNIKEILENEAHRHIKEIEALKNEYDTKDEHRNIIIESLFRNKWSTLNSLCEEYFEKGALPKFQQLLMRNIETEVKNIGSKEGLLQIEEEINKYMGDILNKLRNECPQLKENDIHLCCLIFAGFSVKAICFLMEITSNNLYTRKRRLKQRIIDSNMPHKDLILKRL